MGLNFDVTPGAMTAPGNKRLHYHSWDPTTGYSPIAGANHGYPSHVHAYWDGRLHVDEVTGEVYPYVRKIGAGYPNAVGVRTAGTNGPDDPGEVDVTPIVLEMARSNLVRVDTVLGVPWEDVPVSVPGSNRINIDRAKRYAAPLKDPMVLARLRKYEGHLNPDAMEFGNASVPLRERSAKTRAGTQEQEHWERLAAKASEHSAEFREAFRIAAAIPLEDIDPDPAILAQREADKRKAAAEAAAQDAMAKANAVLAGARAKDDELAALRAELEALKAKGVKKAKADAPPDEEVKP